MLMNGEYLETLQDLKRCFSIEELLYSYESGGLEIWLERIGDVICFRKNDFHVFLLHLRC